MGHLVTALLAKNEVGRDLESVLARCSEFSDEILVLDDRSSDGTPDTARRLGCQVRSRSILAGDAWGNESSARRELWDWMADVAQGGWGLINDCDMLLHGNPRELIESWEVNAWGFILRDLWSPTEFRIDGQWAAGPQFARPWLFYPNACPSPQWNHRGIHMGHAPVNFPIAMGIAPPNTFWWEHRAYISPERRAHKHAAYLSQQDQLNPQELQHAMSILE